MKLVVQSHLFTLPTYGKLRKLIGSEITNWYKKNTKNNKNMKKCKDKLTLGRWVGSMYLYNLPIEGKPKFLYGSLNKEEWLISIIMLIFRYSYINILCPKTGDNSEEYLLPEDIVLIYLQIILTNIKRDTWQLIGRIVILRFARKRKCWVSPKLAPTEPELFI